MEGGQKQEHDRDSDGDEEWEVKHFLMQVRPGNLAHDEEWETDYYNLRRRINQFDRGRSSPL
jgi:hypothetical protein